MAIRELSMSDLRSVVDRGELSKGQTILDQGGLRHLARTENKIWAEAKGSRGSTYQCSVTFGDRDRLKGACKCRAAWSRPFCKHAAALLVAWSKTPEAFAVTEAPAGGRAEDDGAPRKRKRAKAAKVDSKELMKTGCERVSTLVRELAVTGVGTISSDRLVQLDDLAANLRQLRLRRLAGRTVSLAQQLRRKGPLDPVRHASVLSDMLLTAAKVTAHCDGKTLDDRYVEELIGKTWTKKHRKPVEGLRLLEYSYAKHETADDFRVCESRFLDLHSGEHYTERQILPKHIAKTTTPKVSYAGKVLEGARGGIFPGFAPWRLYLEGEQMRRIVTEVDFERMLGHAKPIAEAVTAFQAHRKDVFAPDRMPVMVGAKGVVAQGGRLRVFDDTGTTLHLRHTAGLDTRLGDALEGKQLLAVLGDLDLHHAIPTLWATTMLVRDHGGVALQPVGGPRKGDKPPAPRPWAEIAREAGLSYAAVSIGEVREELADRMVAGLVGLDARGSESLVERLRELKLGKPAALLEQLVAKPDPAERVGDFVKLFQVLGVATARLAGAVTVELDGLVPVPTHTSIYIREPQGRLSPGEVMAARLRGEITPYEAAVHYHRHYTALDAEQMTSDLVVLADGGAMPYVIDAIVKRPELAIEVAETIFSLPMGTTALRTAFGLLERAGTPEAELRLKAFSGRRRRLERYGLRVVHMADDALLQVQRSKHKLSPLAESRRDHLAEKLGPLVSQARSDKDKHRRELGIEALANLGARDAIPELRAIYRTDRAKGVREHAAMALATLGDTRMTEDFVQVLRTRGSEMASTACRALGRLGDSRALPVMTELYLEGFTPSVVAEAWLGFGVLALDPILDMVDANLDLSKRSALAAPLEHMPREHLVERLATRLRAGKDAIDLDDEATAKRVTAYLRLCKDNPKGRVDLARAVLEGHTGGTKGAGRKTLTAARKLVPNA